MRYPLYISKDRVRFYENRRTFIKNMVTGSLFPLSTVFKKNNSLLVTVAFVQKINKSKKYSNQSIFKKDDLLYFYSPYMDKVFFNRFNKLRNYFIQNNFFKSKTIPYTNEAFIIISHWKSKLHYMNVLKSIDGKKLESELFKANIYHKIWTIEIH